MCGGTDRDYTKDTINVAQDAGCSNTNRDNVALLKGITAELEQLRQTKKDLENRRNEQQKTIHSLSNDINKVVQENIEFKNRLDPLYKEIHKLTDKNLQLEKAIETYKKTVQDLLKPTATQQQQLQEELKYAEQNVSRIKNALYGNQTINCGYVRNDYGRDRP